MNITIPEFSYGTNLILKDISLELTKPQIIGLVAPNGTGKSTFIKLISGHLSAPGVDINLDGHTYETDLIYMRRQIVKMPDQMDLYDELTARDHLRYYASLWEVEKEHVEVVIQTLNMSSYCDNPIKSYSLGMRQRVCFALMLVTKAQYLLLDEVMNGLDPDNVDMISDILFKLKEKGTTMLIASHLLENLDQIADVVYFMKDHQLAFRYEPAISQREMLSVQFSDEVHQKSFIDTFTDIPIQFDNDSLYIDVPLIDEFMLEEIFRWLTTHLDRVGEVKLGTKGCHKLFRELYDR